MASEEYTTDLSNTAGVKRQKFDAGKRADSHPVVKEIATATLKPTRTDGGLRPEFIMNVMRPIRVHNRIARLVVRNELNSFASQVRSSMLNVLYPDGQYREAVVITEVQFQNVVNYVLHSRIHQVYGSVTGRRIHGCGHLSRELRLPKSIADVINQYGHTTVFDGFLEVFPQPWGQEADATTRINNVVTHAILESFDRLVVACYNRGFISVEKISNIVKGTKSWLLSADQTVNPAIAADNTSDVISVYGVFPDFTPADAMYAALMINNYDGALINGYEYLAGCVNMAGMLSTRAHYAMSA